MAQRAPAHDHWAGDQRVPGEPASRRVFHELRSAIVTMAFTPGQALSENEIAARLGVSRQPVREAFIKLSEAGLVRIRPQRGTFVVKISTKQVTDARFVREAVEVAVARKATEVMSADAIADLKLNLDAQKVAAVEAVPARFLALDEAFHRGLALGVDCDYAWRVVEEVKAQMDRVRYLSLPQATPISRLVEQHEAILAAVEAGDAAAAESDRPRAPLRDFDFASGARAAVPAPLREPGRHRVCGAAAGNACCGRVGRRHEDHRSESHHHLPRPQLRHLEDRDRRGPLRHRRRHAERARACRRRLSEGPRRAAAHRPRPAPDRGHLALPCEGRLLAARSGDDGVGRRGRHGALGHQGQERRPPALSASRRQEPFRRHGLRPRQRSRHPRDARRRRPVSGTRLQGGARAIRHSRPRRRLRRRARQALLRAGRERASSRSRSGRPRSTSTSRRRSSTPCAPNSASTSISSTTCIIG